MKLQHKRLLAFTLFIIFIFGWFILLLFVSPQEIISYLGLRNTYLVVLFLSIITSGSSVTAGALYVVIVSVVQGGVPLLPVAILSGIGGIVGDSIYYFIGKKSHEVLSHKYRSQLNHISIFLDGHPKLTPLIIFLYAAFMPMPNDILTLSLGLGNYSYKKTILPLALGNIVFFILLLSLATNVLGFVV